MRGLVHLSSIGEFEEAWIRSIQAPDFRLDLPLSGGQLWAHREENGLRAFVFFRQIGSTLEILSLATHPDFRRQGLMKELLKSLIENFCKMVQVHEIWLEVHEKNQAGLQTYLGLGFQVTGHREKYYSDGAGALLMTFTLAKSE
jgi:ribosomal-protein-alanine N-acetyltransferase